jgi:hypothetical protein
LNELAQLILLLCDLESRSLGFRPSVAGALCARQDYAGAANTKSQIVKFERHQTNHSTLQRNDQGIYKPIPHGLALGINIFFFPTRLASQFGVRLYIFAEAQDLLYHRSSLDGKFTHVVFFLDSTP